VALVVFTIFGQGRQHQWSYLVTDKEGYKYLLDERSVREVAPSTYAFLLQRRAADGGTLQSRFRLDLKACTLQKQGEEPLAIRPGTVADTLRVELAKRIHARSQP